MASNIYLIVLNESNYVVWAPYMATILKRKRRCQYMKVLIPYPTDDQAKFIIDGKKDKVVRVIMTYISREILFHLSGIDFPDQFWKKLKSLFE